ncbi:Oxidoreductase [Patulibacter medicamentivorans]|uniref:Oxidoreductase n=1 Tax=Patulibacter medicamentivorans TaxID=1097667 RepID=H0E1X7_9ACTN|nr:Oxidoreductase [Patulibacter medicamentivorans]
MSLDSYVSLGRSGLRVSPFTLGTMTFGEDLGWGATAEDSHRMIAEYIDRGGNAIDTANIYTNGHAEKIVGDYFANRGADRDRVVLGTKFFGNLHPGDPNGGGAGRKAVIAQLEQSLRRLQTDYVDLLWLHNWDRRAPIDETMRALDDLVTAGKVRYVGFSDVPAWKTAEAQTMAGFRDWAPIVALQLEYSLLERTSEGELFPMADELGIAVMPWSPLKSGFLSGKFSRGHSGPVDTGRKALVGEPTDAQFDVIDVLHRVSADEGISPAAAALAWVRGRPGVTSTLIGARRIEQLRTNLDAIHVELSAAARSALDEISAPVLNFPAENNATLAPVLAYGGATIDGVTWPASPMLGASPTRY